MRCGLGRGRCRRARRGKVAAGCGADRCAACLWTDKLSRGDFLSLGERRYHRGGRRRRLSFLRACFCNTFESSPWRSARVGEIGSSVQRRMHPGDCHWRNYRPECASVPRSRCRGNRRHSPFSTASRSCRNRCEPNCVGTQDSSAQPAAPWLPIGHVIANHFQRRRDGNGKD